MKAHLRGVKSGFRVTNIDCAMQGRAARVARQPIYPSPRSTSGNWCPSFLRGRIEAQTPPGPSGYVMPMPGVTDGAPMITFAHEAFLPFDPQPARHRRASLQMLRTFAIWLAAWILVGMIFLGQDVTRRLFYDVPSLWTEVGFWMMRVVLSAVLTLVILWLGTLFPLEKRVWVRRISLHILFSLCFGVARTGLEAVVYSNLTASWGPAYEWAQSVEHTFQVLLIFGLHQALITYWFILAIQTAVRYHEKFQERAEAALRLELNAAELREQVTRAQLGALKMQLQPHFLFNTLNAIMGMVRTGEVRQAERALSRFSDLLRAVLDDMDVQEVPLDRELTYLRLYLSIEQMRFSDRLVVRVDADPDVLDAAVPHMGLQPVVENAVRHGIGCRVGGGSIDVRARRAGDRLHVTIQDQGAGARAAPVTAGGGLGLSNLRARLKQLHGEAGELRIDCADTGATVEMIVPYRRHVAAPGPALPTDGEQP
jgi:two-component system LytT family sensor kinase